MDKRTVLKIYAAVMTVACLCLAGVYIRQGETVEVTEDDRLFVMEQLTFETPEEAIRHFEEGVRQNDLRMILEACAVEDMDVDFAGMISGIGGYSIHVSWPGKYPFSRDMNRISDVNSLVFSLKNMIWSIKLPEVPAERFLTEKSAGDLVKNPEKFQQILDCTDLSGLKIQLIKPLEPVSRESMEKAARYRGAEDPREFLIVYDLGGQQYAGGITVYKIGDNWKIRDLSSPSSGFSFTGGLVPITGDEFEALKEGGAE